jgi:translation initiation factor 2B subunit (eIF-2B alpha/beta/delta family)
LPLGTTFPAARTLRTNGIASAVVASAAVRNIVRRVTVVFTIFFPPLPKP